MWWQKDLLRADRSPHGCHLGDQPIVLAACVIEINDAADQYCEQRGWDTLVSAHQLIRMMVLPGAAMQMFAIASGTSSKAVTVVTGVLT
jgi:hypothetical protein